MALRWSKISSMIALGMLNHAATHTEEQLVDEVETQLALAATGNKKADETRRSHLTLMIHPRVAPVFPYLLAESKRRQFEGVSDRGKPKLEHVLAKVCSIQAKSSGPPLVAFAKHIKRRG
jgi:hypothetical protein